MIVAPNRLKYFQASTYLLSFISSTALSSSPLNTNSYSPSKSALCSRSYAPNRTPKPPMSCALPASCDAIYGGGEGITVKPSATATAAVVFMHGLGDSGAGWATAFPLPDLPHVIAILPNAEKSPVSLNGGMEMPSWFNLYGLDEQSPDDEQGIQTSVQRIERIVDAIDLPPERIVLAGFSQGGALALTAGLTIQKKIAGIVALSSWLPMRDQYPARLNQHATQVPIFVAHGEDDIVVPLRFGQMSATTMSEMGLNVTFRSYSGMSHSASAKELDDVAKFVRQLLPSSSA